MDLGPFNQQKLWDNDDLASIYAWKCLVTGLVGVVVGCGRTCTGAG